MPNDDVLAALTGILEGAASVYIPFQQELQKSRIRQNEGEQTLQRDIRLKQATLPMEEAAKRREAQFQTGEDVRKETLLSPLKMGQEQAKQDRENYITQSDVPPSVLPKLGYKKDDQFKIRKETLPFEVGSMKAGMQSYADVKQKQNILQDLPSRSNPNTPAGAASGVQLAARQLRGLVASPGGYERLGLSKGDAARMVLRSAPQEEVLRSAGIDDTFIQKINKWKNSLKSDPNAIDQPLLRKEFYDLSKELEKSSRPVLERSMNEVERTYAGNLPPEWDKTRAEEFGDIFPDQPFQEKAMSLKPQGDKSISRFNPNTGTFSDPEKHKRYQAYKASLGK